MKAKICWGPATLLVSLTALAGSAGVLAGPAAAASQPPSLRLFAGTPNVSVRQDVLRAGFVDLGVWVTPVGGAFQIDVRRPGYGAWTADQVDAANGSTLRVIPTKLIDPARGLKGFFSVRFIASSRRVAARETADFCPNGERARIDDSGPTQQTYPLDCASAGFFPFVRGVVWGIDPGWAVEPPLASRGPGFGIGPFGFGPPPGVSVPIRVLQRLGRGGLNLTPGRYRAIVTIAPAYQRLFGLEPGHGRVSLGVRVLRSPLIPGPQRVAGVHSSQDPRTIASPTVPDPATMPNLVALPAWRIRVRGFGHRELLTFSATIWNAGPAPLSLEGFRVPGRNRMRAYEYFFDSASNVVGRAPAGTMFYDSGSNHHHWHLRQLAAYELVTPAGQVIRSQKQSFCVAPTDAVDLTVPGAARSPLAFAGLGFGGSVCDLYSPGAIWLREQLPVGWGDTYTQGVAGQAFDITHLPNGRYHIEVQVNPLGQLTETTTADDLAVRAIRLSGPPGKRRVFVEPWHGIRR